jgi:hypothetical protein
VGDSKAPAVTHLTLPSHCDGPFPAEPKDGDAGSSPAIFGVEFHKT